MKKIEMPRIIIYISAVCNLRCKICHEYIPYISKNPPSYPIEQIKKALYEYFQIVSHVKMITISGGEPFLSDHTAELVEFLTQFDSQYDKLEVMTNGTLKPSRRLLDALEENSKGLIFINDYGVLSTMVEEIGSICVNRNIRHIIRNYHGADVYLGGWFDVQMLSDKRLIDEAEIKDRFKHCLTCNNPRLGLSFGLYGRKLFAGSMSGIAARMELIDDSNAYVDLCDDTLSYQQKRDRIIELQSRDYLTACSVCRGNDDRVEQERFVPAEQLS